MISISFFLSLSLPHQTIKKWPQLVLISGTKERSYQLHSYELPVQNSRFLQEMQSIMDTCILIVVCTVAVCVLQILFLHVIERSRNLTTSRLHGNRQGGDEQSLSERIPRRRQPVEQEEWHAFGTLDFVRHLVNLGCFVVVVVDVIVCLVRLALVCLKLVKEFV